MIFCDFFFFQGRCNIMLDLINESLNKNRCRRMLCWTLPSLFRCCCRCCFTLLCHGSFRPVEMPWMFRFFSHQLILAGLYHEPMSCVNTHLLVHHKVLTTTSTFPSHHRTFHVTTTNIHSPPNSILSALHPTKSGYNA